MVSFLRFFFFCAAELLILTLLLHISEISTVNTVLPDELTGRLIVRDHIADIFVFLGCTVSHFTFVPTKNASCGCDYFAVMPQLLEIVVNMLPEGAVSMMRR